MNTFRLAIGLASLIVLGAMVGVLGGQEKSPGWVQMFDQGEVEPRLAGLSTPRGIKVEIIAEGPAIGSPVSFGFGSDGTPLILSRKADKGPVQLIALRDADGDGKFEKSEVQMGDLAGRTSLLVHDGWFYFAGQGSVIRRRPHDEGVAKKLQAAAEAKASPPTAVTSDRKWIEQEIVRGLSAKLEDQSGGLATGFGGWIYLSMGGTDNRPEGWDGSKAEVLGSGAIFRIRPDGSQVQEFARGFAIPVGPPSCDPLGGCFQTENNSQGWRLIHALEGGDYGWRKDFGLSRLDRPGTLPALVQTKSGAPGGVLAYRGTAFPKFFQGLLFLPDAAAHRLHAIVLGEGEVTFDVSSQFGLMSSEDPSFRPTIAAQGPDDAIYVCDLGEPGKGGVLRLTWSGTTSAPAIATSPLATQQAAATRDELLASALNKPESPLQRARALSAACQLWDKTVADACLQILAGDQPTLEQLAADALGDHLPADMESQEQLASTMQDRLLSAALPVRRSLYIALGKLGTKFQASPEWVFEATSVTPEHQTNRYLFDAHVRAVEMPKGWATELLLGNLEVALFDPNPEPEERQRLKKFVVATAEAMRTRELADFLDKVIRDEKDYFSKLEAPLQARLLPAYRNVLVDPPIHADAVALWLAKHPAAAQEVQAAAWETLAAVGTSKPEPLVALVQSLLSSGKLDAALKPSIVAALERHRDKETRSQIDELIEAVKKVERQP